MYFLFLQWLPLGPLFKKALLWLIMAIPGLLWVDLQIDGVKKGSLAKKHLGKVPGPSDIIASSFSSPIDALYLAAVFDPIFTISYPYTDKVQVVSLFGAIIRAFAKPELYPSRHAHLTDIKTLIQSTSKRAIVIFPECTTTNGKGILPLSPCLLAVPPTTKIFPLHLRYAPPDITTPIPGHYFSFLWNLLAQPTHSIRVRIAQAVSNNKPTDNNSKDSHFTDSPKSCEKSNRYNIYEEMSDSCETISKSSNGEKNVLDIIGESLARLGRAKRVGLTVKDKKKFIEMWESG